MSRITLFSTSLNTFFIVLNTLVGFTTSAFSASYIGHEIETGHLTPLFVRFYHAMFQGMMAAMNMALLANNIGVMWVGLELATLMTVIMVGIYRTPQALEAAWKYFILGIVGISLAFFGTILVYLAGQERSRRRAASDDLEPAPGRRPEARRRTVESRLHLPACRLRHKSRARAAACVAARRPCGGAYAHIGGAVRPSSERRAVCAFALQDADGGASRRAEARPDHDQPSGSLSLIFAAFMLYQRRDIKRLFAYSSIEHMGLITFAFGMGGPIANFGGASAHGHAQPDQIGDLLRGWAMSRRRKARSGLPA